MFKIRPNIIKRFCHQHTLSNLNKNNINLIKKDDCIKDKLNAINKKLDTIQDIQEFTFVFAATSWINILVLLIITK